MAKSKTTASYKSIRRYGGIHKNGKGSAVRRTVRATTRMAGHAAGKVSGWLPHLGWNPLLHGVVVAKGLSGLSRGHSQHKSRVKLAQAMHDRTSHPLGSPERRHSRARLKDAIHAHRELQNTNETMTHGNNDDMAGNIGHLSHKIGGTIVRKAKKLFDRKTVHVASHKRNGKKIADYSYVRK
jgi:hypothetical protein